MIMTSDGKYLTGLWFKGSKDELKHKEETKKFLSIFNYTKKCLNIYSLVVMNPILHSNIK